MTTADPHTLSDPAQARIAEIRLHLRPDFSERIVHVRASYRLDRKVSGPFDLDSKDLAIHRVRTASVEIPWVLDRHDAILGQRLRLEDLRGEDSFEIEATTSREAAALQWLRPEQTLGKSHPFLYTQCQACSARSLFPCQDTPSVRFTYEAEIEAPAPLVAVMGAERIAIQKVPGGDLYRFAMRQSIPSYLFAFAVGNLTFESIGPRTGVYGEPEIVPAAAWEYAQNEAFLEAGESLFGPYQWDRYDLLLLPPAFPYGGMENPRLTFFNASYVRGDRSGVWLVAHELAHAWTGNLVTNATWNDFWLNEGPTTYAETRLTEALEGEEVSRLRTAGRARVLLRDLDRLGRDSPMTRLQVDLAGKDPDECYTNVPYYKGMLLFRALEQASGRPAFDRFLRRYIETFQFRSIDSDEFLAFLETELPEAAARVNVRRWIFEPGLPEGAADVPSALRDELRQAADAYRRGEPLPGERVAGWTSLQRSVFVGMLLPRIPAQACEALDALLGIGDTRDGELFCRFCELAVRSGYRAILPRYEAYFASVGRFSMHQDVFRALVAEGWSRDLARPLFERHRAYHHPHTVAALERILTEAGL